MRLVCSIDQCEGDDWGCLADQSSKQSDLSIADCDDVALVSNLTCDALLINYYRDIVVLAHHSLNPPARFMVLIHSRMHTHTVYTHARAHSLTHSLTHSHAPLDGND